MARKPWQPRAEAVFTLSTNSGRDWQPLTVSGSSWASVACSADGVAMLAADYYMPGGSLLSMSSDSGANWTRTGAFGTLQHVACSADSTKLIAAGFAAYQGVIGSLSTSTDSGASWTNASIPLAFSCASISGDGSKMFLGTKFGGTLYISEDAGATWTTSQAPVSNWAAVASSVSGKRLFAANTGDYDSGLGDYRAGLLYTSADGGATLTESAAPPQVWRAVASSAEGNRVVAVASGLSHPGPIYTSADSDAHWSSNAAPVLAWSSVACSADGCKLFATVEGGGIYTWQATPSPDLNVKRDPNGVLISWVVPSLSFSLQESSDLAAGGWKDITDPKPTLNYTNLHYEVSLPSPPGNRFYRLVSK